VKDTLLPDALVDKAREVITANRAAGRRVAIAESCTGGLVSAALTEIAGCSDVFEAGYVTYSNAAKIHELKVSEEVVDTFGAVSVATAWAMARGALAASDADVAVAITGIAGPGGGTPSKPVGTVVFARAERDADPAKIHELKVSEEVVDTFGAVSVATAWAMARGALAASDADVAVAITGIAGPGGGTPSKPVGTVVFARAERDADPAKIVADQKFFDETTRSGVRLQAALCALDLLMP
jgi:nicotinamide-nucleotide amidase